ncbi:ABC transporter ATP-binding protein [Horticoccus luteus]|uniref:ABC transporter ATP-binding protein n=1 Tax=Horticoccus luteus TaxID=2862869 RepID=A0A8F9TZ20_9BACT|nr:ABC transporter ATP-binding protein [Horticoccus luteus]QYM80637.1 ABC transporter ATP-binding protein [Horticoccus luteus]
MDHAGPALEARGLTKDFDVGLRGRRLRALDNVNLRVEAGEVFGLLGANGSGKSTLLKIALGLLRASGGECAVLGRPAGVRAVRRSVGYLPESPAFFPHLTGREVVRYFAALSGCAGKAGAARADEVLAQVGLQAAADRAAGGYSKGMRQRLGLAQALVHDPDLLILDEPTAGVDVVGAAAIDALIAGLRARGKTIVLTSHTVTQIAALCDRVTVLERGRVTLSGEVKTLAAGNGRTWNWAAPNDAAAEQLARWLAERGWPAPTPADDRGRLEQILLAATQGERRDA